MTDLRITHIGGPTALIEVDGWRLLTDPTFDRPRPKVRLRLGHGVAEGGRAGGRRGRSRADRRRAAHPRPPRRQPRPRRTGPPPVPPGSSSRPSRARSGWAVVHAGSRRGHTTTARGGRAAADRDHRHAVPSRPTPEPPARRRRDRLRPPLGRSGARGAVDLGRHGALRRRARGRRSPGGRHRPAPSRWRPLPGHGAGAVHDDRARRRRAVPARRPAHRHSRSTTKAGSTSSKAERRSSASSHALPKTSAGESGGYRSASRCQSPPETNRESATSIRRFACRSRQ